MIVRVNLRSTFYAKLARQVSQNPLSTDKLAEVFSRRSAEVTELKKMSVELQKKPTASLTAAYYKRLNDLGMNQFVLEHYESRFLLPNPFIYFRPSVIMELKRAVPQKSILGMYFKYIIILMLLSVGYNVVKEMKNQAELSKEVTKTNTGIFFKDVRGIDEYKQEMEEVVDFLKSPDKYKKAGAVVPKGVLLNGPPGTGKTLMAKAMASEAGVNFIYKSGSEFDEIFYGVGSQRVRELFAKARANTPCIIFIDEIDAIASKRENKVGSGMNDSLNQLLTEMDGFLPSENIIVLGATNQVDVLDKAILRPGRFDKIIQVSYPDKAGRRDIIKYYLDKIKYNKGKVNTEILVQATTGYSGSQLKNLVNVAALNAIKEKRSEAIDEDFEFAFDRITMGIGKKSMHITERDKLLTAYHEGGHTLANLLTQHTSPLHKVTILPRGSALG